jgi:hypothetical protein
MQETYKMPCDNTLVATLPDAECQNRTIYSAPKTTVQIELNRRKRTRSRSDVPL